MESNSPEPVCGQRQCLIGRVVGNQRSDPPDQSAARSATLGHFLQRSNEREEEQKENSAADKQRGEVRVALEILDQSTARKTRHNTRGEQRAGRGQEEGERKDRSKTEPKTTGEAKEQEPKTRKEEDAPPTRVHRKTRRKRGQERQSQSGHALSKNQRMAKGISKVKGHASVM